MKVTQEDVEAEMQDIITRTVKEFGRSVTYVTIRMRNGFMLHESTQPVDEDTYDENVGKQICLSHIRDKVWFLLGYKCCESAMPEKNKDHT